MTGIPISWYSQRRDTWTLSMLCAGAQRNECCAARNIPSSLFPAGHAIFAASRVDTSDPTAAWQTHNDALAARTNFLNDKRFAALHFRGPGTELRVGLADDHEWGGGAVTAENGIVCNPNIPSEEVATAPHRDHVANFGGARRQGCEPQLDPHRLDDRLAEHQPRRHRRFADARRRGGPPLAAINRLSARTQAPSS